MNASAGLDSTHPYVALSGRVPCKVEGAVTKGQRLIPGSTPGTAKGADLEDLTMTNVIGRALESKTATEVGLVEITVK